MANTDLAPASARPKADWFTDADRNALLGYGLRRGNTRVHITTNKAAGPGATDIDALCRGIQGLVWCDSSLDLSDEAACRAFLNSRTRIPVGARIEDHVPERLMSAVCPRCAGRYGRILARAAAADA